MFPEEGPGTHCPEERRTLMCGIRLCDHKAVIKAGVFNQGCDSGCKGELLLTRTASGRSAAARGRTDT